LTLREIALHDVVNRPGHPQTEDNGKEDGEDGHQVNVTGLSLAGDEQAPLLLLHLLDPGTDRIHDLLAFAGQDDLPGRLGVFLG